MSVLRVHGGKPKYFHALIGGNFRIDELQAAVLRIKLKYLDEWTAGRQRNAAYYDQAFARAVPAPRIVTPARAAGGRHIFNQYVLRAERRDELRSFLSDRHIGTEIYYPVPLHLQGCFGYLGYARGDFPESEACRGRDARAADLSGALATTKGLRGGRGRGILRAFGPLSGTEARGQRESIKTS